MAFTNMMTQAQARTIVSELSEKEDRTPQETARLLAALRVLSNGWAFR